MPGIKNILKSLLPAPLISLYHLGLAYLSARAYRFPSRSLTVIAVTGTKGKSSTTEMLNAIFETAGRKTALLNSIRIKVGTETEPNLMRMSTPGRFFIQRFLRRAVRSGCTVAILEMTSEGARQHRHRAVELDALVFTNLAPEHIESHGSYEAYADAKFSIGTQLARSSKRPRYIVANEDDAQGARYLALPVEHRLPFSLSANPDSSSDEQGGFFTYEGTRVTVKLPGDFSLENALAATTLARAMHVPLTDIKTAFESLTRIPGRAERIEAGQNFTVVVDYAHTPDSLEALYTAYGTKRKICVMGATGGGRDAWKRPVMGALADRYCEHVILTDEDPYDEQPETIVKALTTDMKRVPEILMDRRAAIRRGIELAREGDALLITGKGTDPCICGPHGTKTPWSDAEVAREELKAARR